VIDRDCSPRTAATAAAAEEKEEKEKEEEEEEKEGEEGGSDEVTGTLARTIRTCDRQSRMVE